MPRYVIAYICAAFVFGALDAMWLSWAGPNLYRPIIGEIMAENFNLAAAGTFYFLYLLGMVWFAIRPGIQSGKVAVALLNGVLLGALCYATFDLTSQAVFKVWATKVTVMDIIWGGFATGMTSAVATFVALRFTK
ncbi:DUF2177 family protein [Erythrobacter crassostreae]|uniref:DUF2177 family protein n=1 Tax=Erythrobacter crassostreae TaxID=2828328 RepID=A0A9X1JNN4_9SPHN|nr:DUF2177 family protein [Erythrobacter crassostrea]MBV7259883.1 DUF2177 family protein [Erythrobacter crassostrea]